MKNLELVNAILCILSFIIYFISLWFDIKDLKYGSGFRRLGLVLSMLYSSSLLIRIGGNGMSSLVLLWFIIAICRGLSKYVQYKDLTDKIKRRIHSITSSFSRKQYFR